MRVGGRIWDWISGNALSLGFFLYAFFGAPPLARAMKEGLESEEPLWGIGLLLLAVLMLEPVGVYWKVRFLRRRNHDEGFEPEGSMLGIFSATVIGHMIVTTIVGMVALDGLGLAGKGADPAWMAGASVALVFKDMGAFFSTSGQGVTREPPGHWKEKMADFLLLALGCVAYTAWWQGIFDLGDMASQTVGMKVALGILMGGLFVFLYLPMRLPFLLDECYLRPARGRKARILSELALGALLGFYPAFFA